MKGVSRGARFPASQASTCGRERRVVEVVAKPQLFAQQERVAERQLGPPHHTCVRVGQCRPTRSASIGRQDRHRTRTVPGDLPSGHRATAGRQHSRRRSTGDHVRHRGVRGDAPAAASGGAHDHGRSRGRTLGGHHVGDSQGRARRLSTTSTHGGTVTSPLFCRASATSLRDPWPLGSDRCPRHGAPTPAEARRLPPQDFDSRRSRSTATVWPTAAPGAARP